MPNPSTAVPSVPCQPRSLLRRFLTLTLAAFALASTAFAFHSTLLTAYARMFRVDNATKGADLILILSGYPATRAHKAIQLYRKGYGTRVMVTRATSPVRLYSNLVQDQYQAIRAIAAHEGVPISVLPSPFPADSTFDEALEAAAFVRKHHLHHLVVVTDAFHTARANYAFKKVFRRKGIHIRLELAAADNDTYNETNWWRTENGLQDYLIEPIKFIDYFFL